MVSFCECSDPYRQWSLFLFMDTMSRYVLGFLCLEDVPYLSQEMLNTRQLLISFLIKKDVDVRKAIGKL